jgi:hypothetical protein
MLDDDVNKAVVQDESVNDEVAVSDCADFIEGKRTDDLTIIGVCFDLCQFSLALL